MKKWYSVLNDTVYVLNDYGNIIRIAAMEDRDLLWAEEGPGLDFDNKQNPEATRTPAEDRDLRIHCLELAISAAKSGSSFGESVPKIAQAYYLFSLGEVPPADPFAGLSFEQRLDALVQEFLRSETEDSAKIKHSIEEVYNRLDNQYPAPPIPGDRVLSDEEAEAALAEVFDMSHPANIAGDGRELAATAELAMCAAQAGVEPTIRMQHKDIRS